MEINKPVPRKGEILVKVAANGLCQSALHLPHPPEEVLAARGWEMPFTIGHEVGGWVEEWGVGIEGLKKGQPVALVTSHSCGACLECEAGDDNVCSQGLWGVG
jgi:propanol-preferring alcohol dehydrogenase